jgi:hypothetical protein
MSPMVRLMLEVADPEAVVTAINAAVVSRAAA